MQAAGEEVIQREEAEQAVTAALEGLLVESGPLTLEELTATFSKDFPQLAADLLRAGTTSNLIGQITAILQQSDVFWRLRDGRLAPVLHYLRRATFTHRLSAGELGREAVDLSPDLVALALPRSLALSDGTEVRTAGSSDDSRALDEGSLIGPAGWLERFAVGELVAVRYDGEKMYLESIAEAALDGAASRAAGEALIEAFAEQQGERAPEVHRLIVDTMGSHPGSFSVAVAPLAELLEANGIGVREAWVGRADSAWLTPPEQARFRRLEELIVGADGCCGRSARRALQGWHAWLRARPDGNDPRPELPAAELARLAEDIDHGPVAALLAEIATIGPPIVSMRRLGEWAGEVAAATAPAAGLAYLEALGADARGDVFAAEAHLHAGLQVAAEHPACLGFLAELTQDRGDAQGSVTLLRRTGRPLGPEALRELEPFLLLRNVGRNEPCPCGSGRKFKVCCARTPALRPLAVRCRWLLGKATRHAFRTDMIAAQSLQQLLDSSGGFASANGAPGSSTETMALVADMLLFAVRGLDRYLDGRGALLPADELECGRTWIGRPMRLLEVQGTNADPTGVAVSVVDLSTGERLMISESPVAGVLSDGETILARALPVQELSLLSSALIRVPPGSREHALTLVQEEVRPFQLLQLLVDIQMGDLRSNLPVGN